MRPKRLNLCFNLDDERQAAVYDYLHTAGKRKTSEITELVLMKMTEELYRSDEDESALEKAERSIISAIPSTEIGEIHRGMLQIIGMMEHMQSGTWVNKEREPDPVPTVEEKGQSKDIEGEMSEDAFSAMSSLFG